MIARPQMDDAERLSYRALPVRLADGSVGWKMFGRDPQKVRADFWQGAAACDIAARACPDRATSVRRSRVPRWLVWGSDGTRYRPCVSVALGHTEADALADAKAAFPGFDAYRVERVTQGNGWRK